MPNDNVVRSVLERLYGEPCYSGPTCGHDRRQCEVALAQRKFVCFECMTAFPILKSDQEYDT